MSQSLIPLTEKQIEKDRKNLLISIKKKRAILQKLVLRSESLKVRLDILKREYTVKIGSLVAKDNQLDLEIIHLRNLVRLINEGMTYEEAVQELEGSFFAEQLKIEKEEERIRIEKQLNGEIIEPKTEEIMKEGKKLWRKLITLFHPDLTQDPVEKKRREVIIKQINEAYEVYDFDAMSKIERDNTVNEEATMQNLEEILTSIENEIIEQEVFYDELKNSEWYRFEKRLIKSSMTLDQVYSENEKRLVSDIYAKMEIVKEFEEQIAKAMVKGV